MSPLALMAEGAAEAGLAWPPDPWDTSAPLATHLAANPFLMAPMAGVSNGAWRLMARAGGAALAYSEMVSATGIHYHSAKTLELARPVEGEGAIAVQLFGREPAHFREAARRVAEDVGDALALMDVNMACPVPKVAKRGEGVALMDEPERAAAIVGAVREGLADTGSAVPITAKVRLGSHTGAPTAPRLAEVLAGAGIAALGVHGRFGTQHYRGASHDDLLASVAAASPVPVIGSGDVSCPERAMALLELGCAGVFCARGTYGNPWLFSQARALREGRSPRLPTPRERIGAWRLHVRLLAATGAPMARARSVSVGYLKGLPHAARLRERVMACASEADYLALADEVASSIDEGARE